MANIVVTSDSKTITVDFGIYESKVDAKGVVVFQKSMLSSVKVVNDETYVKVNMNGGANSWYVHYTTGTEYMIIDSIDGTPPTSLSDLRDKIKALMI